MSSLHDIQPNQLTPMLRQYLEIKKQYMDCIVFYRLGDFYEMFFEDAILAAPLLEVQLTSRDKNAERAIPMCGVPYHALNAYVTKLLESGHKVALCEQMEEASAGPGIVRREVTRVFTPGLIPDPDLVSEDTQNLLLAIEEEGNGFSVACFDLLSSTLKAGTVSSFKQILEYCFQCGPKELLVQSKNRSQTWVSNFQKIFPHVLINYRINESGNPVHLVKKYVEETQKVIPSSFFENVVEFTTQKILKLDFITQHSLELVASVSGQDKGSLFSVLNCTRSAIGRRLLKVWLREPLADLEAICFRQAIVEELVNNQSVRESLSKYLSEVRDIERVAIKTAMKLSLPRDLVLLREVQKCLPFLMLLSEETEQPALKQLLQQLNPLTPLTAKMERALLDLPSLGVKEGGIFKESFHSDLAELRQLAMGGREALLQLESREKENSGISTLKIKFSKVFGYTFEITKSHLNKIPSHFIRKQTIANGERFITEELKALEEKIQSAERQLYSLEEKLFLDLRNEVAAFCPEFLGNAKTLATLDVLNAFAQVAIQNQYVKPKMTEGGRLWIENGRHPVLEALLPRGKFVPNSIAFEPQHSRTYLITGPNMGGKSTVMRQVALITLLAHMGSFVPASSATIPLTDSIFTRIGSSDNLVEGKSTFMVEMSEMARILDQATSRSLILIDEIGRGTSTYDGLALAWSLLEYVHSEIQCKTLFASHFHELTLLEEKLEGLRNAHVEVDQWQGNLVFLYHLAPGPAEKSYGIEVAKRAGLPKKVLERAQKLLSSLEGQKASTQRKEEFKIATDQLTFFS